MSEDVRPDDVFTDMALEFEAGHVSPVGEPQHGETTLRRGRPVGKRSAGGSTPVRSFRLPADLTAELDARAEADHVPASEITRRALAAYLKR